MWGILIASLKLQVKQRSGVCESCLGDSCRPFSEVLERAFDGFSRGYSFRFRPLRVMGEHMSELSEILKVAIKLPIAHPARCEERRLGDAWLSTRCEERYANFKKIVAVPNHEAIEYSQQVRKYFSSVEGLLVQELLQRHPQKNLWIDLPKPDDREPSSSGTYYIYPTSISYRASGFHYNALPCSREEAICYLLNEGFDGEHFVEDLLTRIGEEILRIASQLISGRDNDSRP